MNDKEIEMWQQAMEADRQADDWPADEDQWRLDGCTCLAVRGSHKPPCPWAYGFPG